MTQRVYLPLLCCLLLILAQGLIPFDYILNPNFEEKNNELQAKVLEFEQYIQHLSSKDSELDIDNIALDSMEKYHQMDYTIQSYNTDGTTIDFWSKKSIRLTVDQINECKNNTTLIVQNQKYYLIRSTANASKIIVGIFDIEKYLSTHWNRKIVFFDKDKDSREFNILAFTTPIENQLKIKDANNRFLFSVVKKEKNSDFKVLIFICFYLIELFIFLWAIDNFGRRICKKYNLIGSLIVITIVSVLRKLFMYWKIPTYLYTLKLFNPSLFSTHLNPSLGDFLQFIFLTQFLILFINKNLKINVDILQKYKVGFLVHTLVLIFFLGESFSIVKIFSSLVLNSSIWFNFNYFPKITIYSLLGLTVMLMSLSNYFILMKLAIKTISTINLSLKYKAISFFIVLGLLMINYIFGTYPFELKIISFILFSSMIIVYIRTHLVNKNREFSIFIFLLFASLVTTLLLTRYNNKREELIQEAISTMVSFPYNPKIKQDIINFLSYRKSNDMHLEHSSNLDHSSSNFVVNTIDILQYQNELNQIIDQNKIQANNIIAETSNYSIYLVSKKDNYKYIAEKNTQGQTEYFEFLPNNFFTKKNKQLAANFAKNDFGENVIFYALYIHDTLVDNTGQYPYSSIFRYQTANNKIEEAADNQIYSNSLFQFPGQIKVLVTSNSIKPVSTLTLFAYIFCFDLILFFIYQSMILLIKWLDKTFSHIPKTQKITLSNKIIIMILLLLISIFISIAILSYNNLASKTEENNKEFLFNKLNSIQFSLQSFFENNPNSTSKELDTYLEKLSKNNDIDINLFSIHNYQNQHINSIHINPLSELDPLGYIHIIRNNTKLIQYENAQNNSKILTATSKVFPFSSNNNYILSLTLSQNNKIRSDVSNFTVSLINLYIFLFFISLILSIWLANTITNPLKQLTEKLNILKISSKNEYLEYNHNDEIGELVKKYNKMVDEIVLSAQQLASNEREAAWREMAKQIAHEIKNPLTPMKLKIQYLQKKINDRADGIEALTLDVSQTLIEQINNLDMIATSFSNFARLNEPKMEVVDLVCLTRNVCNVFDNKSTDFVHFNSNITEATVLCDPTQMVSCLNNILKNAFQALMNEPNKNVTVNLLAIENEYCIEIIDQGIGMNANVLEKIFTPNFTTKSSGSGLGLAITKKFIDAIDGRIEVISEINQYTKVSIFLKSYTSIT